MNNRQNGRRRGRGGQQTRNGQPGSQDRGNRIDNRARGNAAQLLEKYKSLARDAQTQGDRVNTEYYLQFADHYFRVLSESRSRFDEQRPTPARRDDFRDEFGQDGDDEQDGQRFDGDGQGNWDGEDDRPRQQEERAPRQQDNRQQDGRQQDSRQQDGRQQDERPRQQEDRPRQPRRYEQQPAVAAEAVEPVAAEESQPRTERRPRRERSNGEGQRNGRANHGNGYAARDTQGEAEVSERIEIDRLPQGFSTTPAPAPVAAPAPAPVAAESEAGEVAAPRPRRPRAPRKPKDETVTVDA
jgi:hypothetical protein